MKKFISNITSFCFQNMLFLLRTSPLLLIVFIAFGDQFLPEPLSKTSYHLRTSITSALSIEEKSDVLDNSKYNNRRGDKIVEELSR
ncbi:hypothetical protein AA637_00415 [Cyanobacterium sp. HL-69]|nr:hypothetical protein AA637_00415 [Cyanobacterium sp. HL-69]